MAVSINTTQIAREALHGGPSTVVVANLAREALHGGAAQVAVTQVVREVMRASHQVSADFSAPWSAAGYVTLDAPVPLSLQSGVVMADLSAPFETRAVPIPADTGFVYLIC
jgi:hypothetical protein